MKVLNGPKAALQTPLQASHSRRAMALMGGVFAFTALAALAVALMLEAPATDAVLPDGNTTAAVAPAPDASPR